MALGDGGQQPLPRRALESMSGGSRQDHTFATYIEQRKAPHNQPLVMHPVLLRRLLCCHCRLRRPRQEDHHLRPARRPPPQAAHAVDVEEPVGDDLELEGRSCLRCAQEICDKTRYLRDAAPAGSRGGDTPLHQAAVSKNLPLFCHLITLVGERRGHERAAQALRKLNERQETALHVAVRIGDKDMVDLMLWVDPQLAQISCQDISPIYLAVSMGHKDIAEALHQASSGSAVVSYSGPSEQNALHAAVLHGEEMTKQVLSWNAELATKQDTKRCSPLHFSASVEQRPHIRLWCFYSLTFLNKVPTWHLLDADSSMAYRANDQGLFPVHIAAMANQYITIRILLRRCPGSMGLRDRQGRTFLHVAAQNMANGVVREACFSKGICAPIMNIQDNDGNTALHLAVDVQNLWTVVHLLNNKNVSLNLRNKKGETALDLARSRIRKGFFFAANPDKEIYNTLVALGAKHGNYSMDRFLGISIPEPTPQANDDKNEADKLLEKEESDKLTTASQTLGLGSVLIATVTFGASFTLPGGNIADDHQNGGSPTLAGRWYFNAFMVANTLAFICSSVATFGLMYSGMAMVALPFRRLHFLIAMFFANYSLTCLTAAFALGVYMVLAPVARPTAILICSITPLVLLSRNTQGLWRLAFLSRALCCRKGFWVWLRSTVWKVFCALVFQLWPFAVIFGWAGHLRERRHD